MKNNQNENGEKALSSEIKCRLNPYILDRLSRLPEPVTVSDEWLDVVEQGCKLLLTGLDVRESLAREHLVGYILQEYGVEPFGIKPTIPPMYKPDVDDVVKSITKELRPKKKARRK